MISALSSAVSGMLTADRRFDAGAANVAAASVPEPADLVDTTMVAPVAYAANAAVVRTADEMQGSLLDIFA
jgi:flagellar hook protein FlgE